MCTETLQKQKVTAVYLANADFIKAKIVESAESSFEDDGYLYELTFGETLFHPFYDAPVGGQDYYKLVFEEGNEEDETCFICDIWASTLASNNQGKYEVIITECRRIISEGL